MGKNNVIFTNRLVLQQNTHSLVEFVLFLSFSAVNNEINTYIYILKKQFVSLRSYLATNAQNTPFL